ncbi:DNA-binding protein [candidate division WOR-1 bacterium DG_54_3]|uniref:DNA-binding protein n=1 Tax=candidate division WOR-1 bacterium DG_54_3 TaxID=1703775 RepID=A0A0S7XXB7_UNCSA|nr:MAG: DNA-binding protein [candidate division WOR-1 bacterium DG_54_3]
MTKSIPAEIIENKIYLIKGKKVMLDFDLAVLYGVETKYLKRQVRRNRKRFPSDFMFQLTKSQNLRCQNVTSSYGGCRYLSYAFTEQGVAMLSSVLNSERAIQVNIQIMRIFTKLRRILASHRKILKKIEDMEKKYDKKFRIVFDAIKELIRPPVMSDRRIGFLKGGDNK